MVFAVDALEFRLAGESYIGSTNAKTAVTNISDHEKFLTLTWTENNDPVTLKIRFVQMPDFWMMQSLQLDNGEYQAFYSDFGAVPNSSTSYSTQSITRKNNDSSHEFVVLINPKAVPAWDTVPQESEGAIPDLNSDSVLDLRDYTLMVHNYGKSGAPGFVKADLNGDGTVNKADADQLINQIKIRKLQKFN